MSTTLDVRHGNAVVGTVSADDKDQFSFQYDPSWLDRSERFPVSLTLPFSSDRYIGGPAHTFFANLLPEGAARQAVCARLGISVDNDFALLRAIGGECAGALSVVEQTQPPSNSDDFGYEELDPKRLQQAVDDDVTPLLIGGPKTRLSLAGAQDKVPSSMWCGRNCSSAPIRQACSSFAMTVCPRTTHGRS